MSLNLRAAIAANKPLVVPGVYDGISARIAADLGFDAVYIGSYATGATKYGLPDLGYIGAEDMADQVRRIADLVDVPIIVDGEGGFGNPLQVARTTRLLERAGASAMHIEDHDFGKHITAEPRVLPLALALDKIKAALDAKKSSDFLVIARTDAIGSLGQDEGLARVLAFQDAGADAVMVPGRLDDDGWNVLVREVHVPVIYLNQPRMSAKELGVLGADVVLYYALAHFVAQSAMHSALSQLVDHGSSVAFEGTTTTMADFDSFLGIEAARADAARWGLLEG
jgi:2-methylisocitrate lyase-like PEP mutase family enzyme